MRRAARVDSNHPEIVKALRGLPGAAVLSLASLGDDKPDLLVWFRGYHLLEVKNPARGRRRAEQHDDWHDAWPGPVHTVWSVEEALAAIGAAGAAGGRERRS